MFRRKSKLILQIVALINLAVWTLSWGSNAIAEVSCQRPNGYHMSYRAYVCPLGAKKFEALRMGTHSEWGKQYDLKPIGSANYPRPLPVCPSNGFVMYQEKFSDDELAAIEAIISEPEYQEIHSQNTGHFLLAYIWEKLGKSSYDPWWLYLQASWEADDCDVALHQKYMQITRKLMVERLETQELDEDEQLTMDILIANFDRRLGNFQVAKERLGKAFGLSDPDLAKIGEEYRLELLRFVEEENTDRQVMRSIQKTRNKNKD